MTGPADGVRVLRLTVTTGVQVKRTAVNHYFLSRLDSAIGGQAFRLQKFAHERTEEDEPDHYDVRLDGPNSACDCKGFLKHGMQAAEGKGCKHIASLAALVAAGKL